MVEAEGFAERRRTKPAGRGVLLAVTLATIAAAVCFAALIENGGFSSATELEGSGNKALGRGGEGGVDDAGSRHEAHKHRVRHSHGSLMHLQALVKEDEKKEGDSRAKVVSTEDAYVASRTHAASIKAERADEIESIRKLELEKKDDNTAIKGALLARKKAASRLAERQNAAKHALATEVAVFGLENKALEDKDASEKDEAEGIAIQEPAAALLKDSQKLNDQSNLVLDQSKSTQAKALAALDLNLAQSLARRASDGMSSAKGYFSRAIAERKKAVGADDAAASKITAEAKLSLGVNHEVPELLHVLHGQDTGDSAIRHVVDADEKAVNRGSITLGEDRQAVQSDYSARQLTYSQISLAEREAQVLRKELVAAQTAVVAAAKAHVEASKSFRAAQAGRREAEDRADALEGRVRGDLQEQLKAAVDAGEASKRVFKKAKEKVESLEGKQTLLKMRVARLRLQLKEASMRGAEAKEGEKREREQRSELQTQLDKEDGELNAERLRLADAKIAGGGGDGEREGGGERERRGRRHATRGVHDEAARAEEEADGGSNDVLERERERERVMRRQQAKAELRARDEERKLKEAQRQVQAQMSKVRQLEGSV